MIHKETKIFTTFDDGPKVEVKGTRHSKHSVEFVNKANGEVVYKNKIKNNMWTQCSKKWNIPWLIRVNGKVIHDFNLEGKNVKVIIDSKSVGDTIAWMPQVVEFQKYYKCKVTVSSYHNEWFEGLEAYNNINFTQPNTSGNYYAQYKLGWFTVNSDWDQGSYHPTKPNTIPLIQTATDILNLPYKEINYGLNFKPKESPMPSKYVCIGPRATAGLKEWPHHYWPELAKMLGEIGYKVINISYEGFSKPYIIDRPKLNWQDTFNYLYHADLFIGLGSGLSWFNWAMNKRTLMINNFIPFGYEMTHNVTKVEDYSVCNNCWVDPRHKFDKGKWEWCPRHQNTPSEHICHKAITPGRVFKEAQKLLMFN